MTSPSDLLGPPRQAFFLDYLGKQKRASPHTVASCRDTLRLLLTFVQETTGTAPSAAQVTDLALPLAYGSWIIGTATRQYRPLPQYPSIGDPLPLSGCRAARSDKGEGTCFCNAATISSPAITDEVGIAGVQAEHLLHRHPGVHARHNGQFPRRGH